MQLGMLGMYVSYVPVCGLQPRKREKDLAGPSTSSGEIHFNIRR